MVLMIPSSVPRVFVLAGLVLLLLVVGTSHYLYDDSPYPGYQPQRPDSGLLGNIVSGTGDGRAPSAAPEEVVPKPMPGDQTSSSSPPHTTLPTVPSTAHPAYHNPFAKDGKGPAPGPGECPQELTFLKKAQEKARLSETISYQRRCLHVTRSDHVDRSHVAEISQSLIEDEGQLVDLAACDESQVPECTPIQLSVSHGYKQAKFPHLIFGIATSYDRLSDSVAAFGHWLNGSDARLVAIVTDLKSKSKEQMEDLRQRFEATGVNVTLSKPLKDDFSTSQSHFTVLVHMLNLAKTNYGNGSVETQWFGLLDDDTFFPHLEPLAQALDKIDHTKEYYVGTLSEDFEAIRAFGYMAFGGAGAYLSAPLARRLGAVWKKCIKEATAQEGDIIVRDCVYHNSKAKLTMVDDLYQQDFQGDVSGWFESGVSPINLHHWKSWYRAPVLEMASAASFCGDCFLQRWRFGSQDILSNGYSIAKYRHGTKELDLNTTESTWSNFDRGRFAFSCAPFRDRANPADKKSYILVDSSIDEKGNLNQLYAWRGNATAGEPDEVVELVWRE